MITQGAGGGIVNITSQAGVVGAPKRGPYIGAKAGVNNLSKTMAAKWGEYNIRVNEVGGLEPSNLRQQNSLCQQ